MAAAYTTARYNNRINHYAVGQKTTTAAAALLSYPDSCVEYLIQAVKQS